MPIGTMAEKSFTRGLTYRDVWQFCFVVIASFIFPGSGDPRLWIWHDLLFIIKAD